MYNAPGKAHRQGLTFFEVVEMFGTEKRAHQWFQAERWPDGPFCPHCGSLNVQAGIKHPTMTHRCRDCPKRPMFSLRTGTAMQSSKLGYRVWAVAIHCIATNIKGVSSMRLHRELGISQKAAWHLLHRIREAFAITDPPKLSGTVEVDAMFVGGKQSNRHAKQRKRHSAEDHFGKKPVVGAVQRGGKVVAMPIGSEDANTMTRFVESSVRHGSKVYTDDHGSYTDLMESYRHRTVKHSIGEYVKNVDVHTNTVESLWSMFKRGFVGTYHRMSFKAPTPLRQRVRGPEEHPGTRYTGPDERDRSRLGAQAPPVPRLGRVASSACRAALQG